MKKHRTLHNFGMEAQCLSFPFEKLTNPTRYQLGLLTDSVLEVDYLYANVVIPVVNTLRRWPTWVAE